MNIIQKNKIVIETLIQEHNEFATELKINDNNTLSFRNLTIDLASLDLEVVLNSLNSIDLNSLYTALSGAIVKEDNEKKWEMIKQENPNMKSITIFKKHNLKYNTYEEFINIRTSDGVNHLFKNSFNFDIFNEYMKLKEEYGDNITPELLASSIQKWQINELPTRKADEVIADPTISENIKNQLQEYVTRYKDNKNIEITVNTEEDIIFINDTISPEKSYIITFTKDINNELVATEHSNNVSSESYSQQDTTNPNQVQTENTSFDNSISNSETASNNLTYQNPNTIISDDTFNHLLSKGNLTLEELNNIHAYLNNFEYMVDNQNPYAEEKAKTIEEIITNFNLSRNSLTEEEQAIVDRFNAIFDKLNKKLGHGNGSVLTYKTNQSVLPDENEENTSSGYSNIISIFIAITMTLIAIIILAISILK